MATLVAIVHSLIFFFFFFNDTATTEIYTLSLHDALPISRDRSDGNRTRPCSRPVPCPGTRSSGSARAGARSPIRRGRSEEHTSELQSRSDLVCRLLLEKKKEEKKSRRDHR